MCIRDRLIISSVSSFISKEGKLETSISFSLGFKRVKVNIENKIPIDIVENINSRNLFIFYSSKYCQESSNHHNQCANPN